MFKAEFTWRENALADVLGVVHDTLVHVLAVDGAILLDDFAVIVTEERIEQVLVPFSLISDELSTAE